LSILIKNASYVLTQDKSRRVLKDVDILVEGSRISKVGKGIEEKAEKVIDGRGKAVLPGLINIHAHTSMSLLRGIADDVDLSEWLEKKIFPLEAKLTEDDIYCGALAAALEMVKSGTTSLLDMYFMMDSVAKACKEIGIRGFLSAGIMDIGATQEEAGKKLDACERFIKRWSSDELVTPSVGPHAIYTCSADFLRKSNALAQKHGVLVNLHLSETQKEFDDCKREHGIAPAEYLEKLGLLGPRLVVAHAVWLTDKEMDLMKARGVSVAHCPVSNLKLGSGIAPIYAMRKKGIGIGLGTDGAASNNNLDLFEEIKLAALLQKGVLLNPKAITAQEALDMATIGGARCLGAEDRIGSVEEGKLADLILVDLDNPRFTPMHNILSNIVYSANGSDVLTTIINGKVVMEDRRLLTSDEGEILRKVQAASDNLLKRA
jgi:5-methylthioadenosine/S-adenosylhomocysteine deaminase